MDRPIHGCRVPSGNDERVIHFDFGCSEIHGSMDMELRLCETVACRERFESATFILDGESIINENTGNRKQKAADQSTLVDLIFCPKDGVHLSGPATRAGGKEDLT